MRKWRACYDCKKEIEGELESPVTMVKVVCYLCWDIRVRDHESRKARIDTNEVRK